MNPTIASTILGPVGAVSSDTTSPRRIPELLAGTGTTESHNSGRLIFNNMATVIVGAVPIRFILREVPGLADGVVATTDIYLAAGATFTWTVDALSRHIYVEAADGVAAYEAWVWKSS